SAHRESRARMLQFLEPEVRGLGHESPPTGKGVEPRADRARLLIPRESSAPARQGWAFLRETASVGTAVSVTLAWVTEVVRTPIGPDARLTTRRTLEERLMVLWPSAWAALSRALRLLPPRSRFRRALLRRNALSGWGAWVRGDLDLCLVRFAPNYHCEAPHE